MPGSLIHLDSLALVSMSAYLLFWLITVAASPAKDFTGSNRTQALLILAGTLLGYASGSVWLFLLGWTVAIVPAILAPTQGSSAARAALIASTAALALGAGLTLTPGHSARNAAYFAFLAATLIRKGIFPLHFWLPRAFETQNLSLLSLNINGHLGAYLLVRYALTMSPEAAADTLPLLNAITLFTSVYAALLALTERSPRRILGLLCVSQAAFILAGLENSNVEGVTGGLVHWWVVAFATTGMITVYRALEVRTTEVAQPAGFLGLAIHAPRLAAFFAVAGLALIGLPGTLGFAAEDLLFHGTLESHPLLGIALPLATALNAITTLRLFSTLFLGRRSTLVTPIPDARPAQRWALAACAVLLVAGGLAPGLLVSASTPAAVRIAQLITAR
ncbi:MAG: proton-conducting transporter membrane subunit [Bryobacteraceae bacterium]